MVVWLLDRFSPIAARLEQTTAGDSRIYLTARIALAALTSFLAAVLLGPFVIRWLRRQKLGERIDSASDRLNELHALKKDTPTMGGVFMAAAITTATLLWADLENSYVWMGLLLTLGFGALGSFDDWVKLTTRKRGLSARAKLAVQGLLAAVATACLYAAVEAHSSGAEIIWPIGNVSLSLGFLFIPWGVVVIVGSSNGVNLTDGLDGLAAGCLVFAGVALAGLAYVAGNHVLADYLAVPHRVGAGELAVLASALVGAALGFLWFNAHPAEVFMGDAGSLPLGALLGYLALAIKQEALLIVIGGVFVAETVSVILQVACFKLTGRRVLACSPLHHHFQFRGVPEAKIVVRFWIVAALLAIAGLASLKVR